MVAQREPRTGPETRSETSSEREERVARERSAIAEARRELAEGRGITGDDAVALLQALREGRPLPFIDDDSTRAR